MAQKFPELFFDEATVKKIGEDTLQAVFQRDSATLNHVTNWIKGKGDWFDLAVATVAPYKLTPWNIIGEIMSYNPVIAMAKTLRGVKRGDTRLAKINAGKMAVGTMLTYAGWWLYKKGLLAPSLDEKDESQKSRILAGEVMPPNHINISGLERALSGKDPEFKPGDRTVDIFRAGGLAGAMFYMTANIGRDFERMPEVGNGDIWTSLLRQSALEQARFGLQQSFLSGAEGLLTAVKDGNADNYIRQWANTATSIPLPNTLSALSRATREYKPELGSDSMKGKIDNLVKNKLGLVGLDEQMTLKRDLWGQPMQETPEGRNSFIYHLFDITKGRQVSNDPVAIELYRLWRRTGDSSAIPSLVGKTATIGGTTYALDTAQQSRLSELVGKNRKTIVDAIVVNPNYHKLNDEQKIKILESVYQKGREVGKAQFYAENHQALKPKQKISGFDK